MAVTGASEDVQVAIGGDASSLREATDSAVDALGSVKKAAGLAGAALSALAVGGLAKATQQAAAFEEQMIEVEKVTDPETAREMGAAIQEMAARMPVAQKELADITAQAGRFGVEGSEDIRQFTETVAQMAVATDLSTTQAGEAFARLSTLLDEPMQNVDDLGNVINELSNSMATSSSEITDSALRSSGVLTQMGASSEDILALNAAMNEASESAERAGTRLRRMAQEIQAPKKVEALADALGMSADEFATMREEDPTALFREMASTMAQGDEAADALRSTLSTTSQQALNALSQNMEGLADAQAMANRQMNNGTSLQEEYEAASSTFNSQLQVTQNRLRNVAIQIGQNVLPAASTLLGHINNAIQAFSKWNQQSDGVAGTVGLVATALSGLAVAVASAVSYFGGMTAVIGAVGGALSLLTGPVGIAIAAIALLAGAWQTNLWNIRGHTKRIFGVVQSLIQTALSRIQAFWGQHGAAIMSTVKTVFNTVASTIRGVLTFIWSNVHQPILNRIQSLWDKHGQDILNAVGTAFTTVRKTIQSVLQFIWGNLIRPTLNRIQSLWQTHGDALTAEAQATFDHIRSVIQDFVTFAEPYVNTFLTGLRAGIEAWVTVVTALWDTFGDEIVAGLRLAFTTIELVVGQATDAMLTIIRTVLALIRGDWEQAWSIIEGYLDRTLGRIESLVKSWKETVTSVFSGLVDGVISLAQDLYQKLIGNSIFKDIFQDIASYIRNDAASDLVSAATSAANSAANALVDAFNSVLPDSLSIPSVSVGGGSLNIPSTTINIPEVLGGGSETIGGGSLNIPHERVGGQSLDLPSLDTGGLIDDPGLAMLHAGERVVPASQVSDRGEVVVDGGADAEELAGAIEQADRSEAIVRELQQTRRAIVQLGEEFDLTIETRNGSRYDPRS